jgi:hypothetical protein
MRLSGLLRGVLKSGDEFVALGEELDLIEAYLDIERARFEDRLHVRIDVPLELRAIAFPRWSFSRSSKTRSSTELANVWPEAKSGFRLACKRQRF